MRESPSHNEQASAYGRIAGFTMSAGFVVGGLVVIACSGRIAALPIVTGLLGSGAAALSAVGIGGSAAMGAGISGGIYSATSPEFSAAGLAKELVIGGVTSGATAGIGDFFVGTAQVTKSCHAAGQFTKAAAKKILPTKLTEKFGEIVASATTSVAKKAVQDSVSTVSAKLIRNAAIAVVERDLSKFAKDLSITGLAQAGMVGIVSGQVGGNMSALGGNLAEKMNKDTMVHAAGRMMTHTVAGAAASAAGKTAANVIEGKKWSEGLGGAAAVGGMMGAGVGATREYERINKRRLIQEVIANAKKEQEKEKEKEKNEDASSQKPNDTTSNSPPRGKEMTDKDGIFSKYKADLIAKDEDASSQKSNDTASSSPPRGKGMTDKDGIFSKYKADSIALEQAELSISDLVKKLYQFTKNGANNLTKPEELQKMQEQLQAVLKDLGTLGEINPTLKQSLMAQANKISGMLNRYIKEAPLMPVDLDKKEIKQEAERIAETKKAEQSEQSDQPAGRPPRHTSPRFTPPVPHDTDLRGIEERALLSAEEEREQEFARLTTIFEARWAVAEELTTPSHSI